GSLVSPTIAVYRYDAPLLFLNSDLFIRKALDIVDDKVKMLNEKETLYLIIDASGFTCIDYTGIERLKDLSQELKNRNVEIFMAASKGSQHYNIYELKLIISFIRKICLEPQKPEYYSPNVTSIK
uniref:STAS domain-containing protein n=1 Tax=Wuchereria bancrofti TaxID=6293 RepID=A0A1I8EBU9_WUCBA